MTFKEFYAFSYLNESRLKLKNRVRMINGLGMAIRKINGWDMPYTSLDELEIEIYLQVPLKQMKHWRMMGPKTITELKLVYETMKEQAFK